MWSIDLSNIFGSHKMIMLVTSNADATMHNLCAMSKKFETVARTRVYKTAEIKGNRHALGRTNLSSGFSVALDVQWTEAPSSKYGLTESINHLNTGENIKFALKKGPQYSAARIATCCHAIHKRLCRKTVSTSPTSRRTRREMLVGDRQYTVPLILSLILTFNSIRSLSSFPLSNHLPSLPRKRTKHNL